MGKDVAIEEIREVRHRISEKYGHNTRAILAHYKELEVKYKERMLRRHRAVGEAAAATQ